MKTRRDATLISRRIQLEMGSVNSRGRGSLRSRMRCVSAAAGCTRIMPHHMTRMTMGTTRAWGVPFHTGSGSLQRKQ
eukprot:5319094-Prymnesium_polylepis.1